MSYKRVEKRRKIKEEKERRIQEAKEREIKREERAKSLKEFWDNIKIGKKYTGTVDKITDYGLFINLGPTKGLLHISEIFWNKEEKLADKFKIDEVLEVTIKSFDKNESKISLAYPQKGENPWYALASKYNINDVVTCKVIKFAPFGAFVEIEKGLEGLVHNSEITTLHRVAKPEDELEIGQMVNAKIINIDKESRKIGLSIKELEGTSKEYGYEDYINNK